MIEKHILSYLVKDKTYLDKLILRRIGEDCFLQEDNRSLLAVILWYYKKYSQLLTGEVLSQIINKSRFSSEIKSVLPLLFKEVEALPTTVSFDYLLDELIQQKVSETYKGALINAVSTLERGDVDTSFSRLKTTLFEIDSLTREDLQEGTVAENVEERDKLYKEVKENPFITQGIMTGFPTLDRITNGFKEGDLTIVVGATGTGKSTFLLQVGHKAYIDGKNVLYVQIETSKIQLERRFDALDANLSSRNITRGQLSSEEEQHYKEVLRKQKEDKTRGVFYIFDVPSRCSASVIEAKVKELSAVYKFDLIIVDYLGIMVSDRKADSLWQGMRNIAQELKELARKVSIPVVTAVQVNREGMKQSGQKFELFHISLSNEIAPQADIVLSLRIVDEEELELGSTCEIQASILKNRNEGKGRFRILVDFDRMSMVEDEHGRIKLID